MKISDITAGLIETLLDVSHDPDDADYYEVIEYIENLPNPARTLKELAIYLHSEYL